MDSNIIEWLNLVVRWIHVIKGIFSRPNGIWRRVDGFDFTVFGLGGVVFGVVPLEKNVLAVINNSAGKDQKKKVELSSQRFAIGVFCPASGRV